MRIVIAGLALAAGLASSPALARDQGSSLVLQSPAGARAEVIVDGAAWVCHGAVCATGPGGLDQPAARACRRLVRALGPVTAFTWQGQRLTPQQVAACDAAAAKR